MTTPGAESARRIAPDGSVSAKSPIFGVPTRDFGQAPFLVIWETTRACDLACVHCRAGAVAAQDPLELSLAEAVDLFASIRAMGTRMLVLTGGDPLKRPDIQELIAAAGRAGLNPSLSPSATPLLTPAALQACRDAGLTAVSLSIDGAGPVSHDAFRGVAGSFDRTMQAAGWIRQAGLDLRINTTVTSTNVDELPELAGLVEESGARIWSVFFLVETGRAGAALQIAPDRCERTLEWLYRLSREAPFRIKTTDAPHYRRVVIEQMARETGLSPADILARNKSGRGRFMPGMNDARGFVFISHHGDVYPSGFFPLPAGNVRRAGLAEIYRESPLFRGLRDPDALNGRCGRCSWRALCGGSRARAWAAGGDPLGEDPLCAYEPEGRPV